MSSFRIPLAFIASLLLANPALANAVGDDSDLSGSGDADIKAVSLELHADEIRVSPESPAGSLQVEIFRQDHGKLVPVQGLPLAIPNPKVCVPGGKVRVQAELRQTRFEVTNGGGRYRIADDIPCSGHVQLVFKSDSDGGQALGIWNIARLAETKLEQAIGLSFWKTQIQFVWPDSADYYSWGRVHVSRGDQWDVVGHELGHAIYDLGDLGAQGGGQHKIDECYTATLALSEGWASFFSAWLHVDAADPDAKFEFLVPRRAPIRFENIPSDVCRGEKNEWRVTGFFWDLYDFHEDGERSEESFSRMWLAMAGSRAPSTSAARERFRAAGIDPGLLDISWALNFQ